MAIKPPRAEKPAYTFPAVMMAPIAGITDRSFRDIVRQKGCPLTFTELISARGVIEKNPGTWRMLEECRGEENLIIQLFGNGPDYIAEAVRMVADLGPVGVNLNLGCPARKVFKRGEGCGLTVFPTDLVYVLRAMRQATPLHLSVKIRSGVDFNSLNYRIIGDIAQGEGCDALIFHARTRKMGFGGIANWDWILDLKEYLDIPVIGNGDVVDVLSAKRMLEETGCDGIMIGRGCYGNPWIFKDILHFLESGEINDPPSLEERFAAMIDHIHLSVHYKGPRKGVYEMRKHVGWYVKGMRNVRPLRDRINKLETMEEVIFTLRDWLENHEKTWEEYFDDCKTGSLQETLSSSSDTTYIT